KTSGSAHTNSSGTTSVAGRGPGAAVLSADVRSKQKNVAFSTAGATGGAHHQNDAAVIPLQVSSEGVLDCSPNYATKDPEQVP
ncbi:unnamed protein product, partial [Amoebophrya sp. A120]